MPSVVEQNLASFDFVAYGVGGASDFLGNFWSRPAIAESGLDDDSFLECEMCPFAMR